MISLNTRIVDVPFNRHKTVNVTFPILHFLTLFFSIHDTAGLVGTVMKLFSNISQSL